MKISHATSAEELVEAVEELDPEMVVAFEEVTLPALGGSFEATKAFARYVRVFADEVFSEVDPRGQLRESGYREALLYRCMSSPMSGWVASFGFGRGVAASVAACGREMRTELRPIAPPGGIAPELVRADFGEFVRRAMTSLRLDEEPLTVIGRELGLNKRELGGVFGVSRQAVGDWMDKGVPSQRMSDVSTALKVVQVMSRKLKPGRLPLVAHRPAPAFGGKTLLEALHDDPQDALSKVDEAFDWSGTA
ncbi:MAG TPA: hypothetical protein VFC03_06930 [Acidimicrobiales bacterium]|nr:hypothetical protein [Acidimicrobiales bacterium]